MKPLKPILLAFTLVCSITIGFAQKNYAPFKFDESGDFALTLNIKQSPFVKKFSEVMRKHHRDPSDVTEWVGVFDIIVGMKDTDLAGTGDLTFDSDEDVVRISATKKEEVDAVLKDIKQVIATPAKLDAFLTDFETTLEKAKKK